VLDRRWRRNVVRTALLPALNFELSDVLKAGRPYASIVFVAWIFVGFLQQRDDAAPSRYRLAISDFRSHDHSSDRHDNIREQILVYKRRWKLMNYACQTGWDPTTVKNDPSRGALCASISWVATTNRAASIDEDRSRLPQATIRGT
jgi:hypothetical protein